MLSVDRVDFFKSIESQLSESPDFLRPKDLIRLGLFKSPSDVTQNIRRGDAPPLIRLGVRKLVFPKSLLVEWLNNKTKKNGGEQ